MRINRLELIEKIRTMIKDRELQAEERKAQAYDVAGLAETKYVDAYLVAWGKFADVIRLRNRNRQAITINDIPKDLRQGYGTIDFFRPTVVRPSDYTARTSVLTNLLAILESSPDELISTSALDRMGAPLRELLK